MFEVCSSQIFAKFSADDVCSSKKIVHKKIKTWHLIGDKMLFYLTSLIPNLGH